MKAPVTDRMPRSAVCLQALSMLWYLTWLLLPAVQCFTHAVTGLFSLLLFGAGVLLDTRWSLQHWRQLSAQVLCMALLPLMLKFLMLRGADTWGFLAAAILFFFPLVFAAHAIARGDERLWRYLRVLLLIVVCITVCTTVGWLIQGMLRGGKVYAYSRSLGYAGDADAAAYLRQLMLRNIGGYDFIYAMTACLPLTFLGILRQKGLRRGGFIALYALQTVAIVLSQYTYAMLYAAIILWLELAALLLRKISRHKLSTGMGMLIGCLPLLAVVVLRMPLVNLAVQLSERLGLANFAQSFRQLQLALQGAAPGGESRLTYYRIAWEGFLRSPLLGSLLSGEKAIGGHSELLDLLSGTGLIGCITCAALLFTAGKPLFAAVHRTAKETRAHLWLCIACVLVTAALGTVIYSRDIAAVTAIGLLLITQGSTAKSNVPSSELL